MAYARDLTAAPPSIYVLLADGDNLSSPNPMLKRTTGKSRTSGGRTDFYRIPLFHRGHALWHGHVADHFVSGGQQSLPLARGSCRPRTRRSGSKAGGISPLFQVFLDLLVLRVSYAKNVPGRRGQAQTRGGLHGVGGATKVKPDSMSHSIPPSSELLQGRSVRC